MEHLHPAAQWVLIAIAVIGVAGLLWAAALGVFALGNWWRARQEHVDFLLWDGEMEDEK